MVKPKQVTYVYVKDTKYGWIPASQLSRDGNTAKVILHPPKPRKPLTDNNDRSQRRLNVTKTTTTKKGDGGGVQRDLRTHGTDDTESCSTDESSNNDSQSALKDETDSSSPAADDEETETTIDLSSYSGMTLPLQDVDLNGNLIIREDMSHLPFLHEASILYNLKENYEGEDGVPYTKVGDIIISVNPWRWIKGLYAQSTRHFYAEQLVWKANRGKKEPLPPHLYETSCKAIKGLCIDGQDQSILVSGESGAGKTISVKILMSHLATFDESKYSPLFEEKERRSRNSSSVANTTKETNGDNNDSCWCWITNKTNLIDSTLPPNNNDDEISHSDSEPEEMEQTNIMIQKVLDSNPLLEAFGNAKTLRNDNSSRFSKYVKLQFEVLHFDTAVPSCNLIGSVCDTFLLEKSRVVSHATRRSGGSSSDAVSREEEERTFHIFYQLLAAPEEDKRVIWKGLVDRGPEEFSYVGLTRTDTIEGYRDDQRWGTTLRALDLIGVRSEEYVCFMRTLCVVMQLGNVNFVTNGDDDHDDAVIVSDDGEWDRLAEIMQLEKEHIDIGLTTRTVVAGKETLMKTVTVTKAREARDSLAKELYVRLFRWLTSKINKATSVTIDDECDTSGRGDVRHGFIGLLDIFGFETFEVNNFEQLLINHANEKLQEKFTLDTFSSVQLEYKEEGISLDKIDYDDNSQTLNLIEGRMGLIDLLNEECLMPKPNEEQYVSKIYQHNYKTTHPSCALRRDNRFRRNQFAIQHYAATVTYTAQSFVSKNLDTIPLDVINFTIASKNKLIKSLCTKIKNDIVSQRNNNNNNKNNNERQLQRRRTRTTTHTKTNNTVWSQFKTQLTTLLTSIQKTKTYYVKCINPNTTHSAGVMNLPHTLSQLHCAGVLSAVTISRHAFPNRLPYNKVMHRFRILVKPAWFNKSPGGRRLRRSFLKSVERQVMELLDDLFMMREEEEEEGGENDDDDGRRVEKAYVCGKTLVYFRAGALEYLEGKRLTVHDRCASRIQQFVRQKSRLPTLENKAGAIGGGASRDGGVIGQVWCLGGCLDLMPFRNCWGGGGYDSDDTIIGRKMRASSSSSRRRSTFIFQEEASRYTL